MKNEHELVLFDFWPSFFGMRVRIALAEKGITDYVKRQEDLLSGKSLLLLEMNPVHKKVPVLVHNGKPVCESLVILEYIDDVWKDRSRLLSNDPLQRARARFWANYVDTKFVDAGRKVWRVKGEEQLEASKKEFLDSMKLLEQELGDKPYFGGDTFGYLDIALIPDYSWFYVYERFAGFSIEAFCPKLITWAKRCMQRQSVKNSLPDQLQVYQYALDIKARSETQLITGT